MGWTPLHLSTHLILSSPNRPPPPPPSAHKTAGPTLQTGKSRHRAARRRDGRASGAESAEPRAPSTCWPPRPRAARSRGARGMRGGGGRPRSPAHVSGPARSPHRPLAAAAAGGPSLRRLAFHLRIFHAGLAWRRAVCGPHKGRRVLHSSRWGPAGEGAAAWRGARRPAGGAAPRRPGRLLAERAPFPGRSLENSTFINIH